MSKSFDEIRQSENQIFREHNRKYWICFGFQWGLLFAGALAGAVNAHAQSQAVQGTPMADPTLLFWVGIVSAIVTLFAGSVTVAVAKQKKLRDFHEGMVGKIDRGRWTDPKDAENAINDYFDKRDDEAAVAP